jgi:cytoskeletal protein CcmA (bactofilin family)
MFGKDAGAPGESKLNSIVGKGSNCQGDIVVAGGIKIDGNFKGTVKADAVFVGRDAIIEATIDTNVAVIGGKVVGDVVARQSLELQTKAELIGDVTTKVLVVAETAVLDGLIDMGQKERHIKKPAKPQPAETAGRAVAASPAPASAAAVGGTPPKTATPTPVTGSPPAQPRPPATPDVGSPPGTATPATGGAGPTPSAGTSGTPTPNRFGMP